MSSSLKPIKKGAECDIRIKKVRSKKPLGVIALIKKIVSALFIKKNYRVKEECRNEEKKIHRLPPR
jgi:hypothetical protein